MREKVQKFLAERFLVEIGGDLDEHSDLFQLGLIDSQGYVELVAFMERDLGIALTDEEILSNVLVSFSGILSFVEKKQLESRRNESPAAKAL
jgi:acyl carrier protein